MKSATPKHLHPLLGRRMVDWVVEAARGAGVGRIVVVASPSTRELYEGLEVAVQEEPRGTGDAVRCAREALGDFDGDVLVLNGDVPALRPETIAALVETHRSAGAAATVLSFEPADAAAYGRIVRDANGGLARIVEARDASPEELELGEVNSGIYVFDAAKLWPALERLTPHNAQAELYVTDTLGHPRRRRRDVRSAARRRSARGRRDQHARRARRGRRAAARPHQHRAHARGRNDRRPRLDVDRRGRRDRAGRRRSIRSPSSAATVRIASGVEIGPFASIRTLHAARPGREGRHVRRAQERRASGRARRSRTSPTSATPRSARTRTSPPATSPRTSATSRASRRSARRSAATSGPESTIRSSHPSRLGTTHGLRQGPSSRRMCLRAR